MDLETAAAAVPGQRRPAPVELVASERRTAARADDPPPRTRRWVLLLPLLLGLGVAAPGASVVWLESSSSRTALQERFEERSRLTSTMLSRHVDQLFERELVAATASLAGPQVQDDVFAAVVRGLGVQAAVLLDDDGRLLASYPGGLVPDGTPVAGRYRHLTAALRGERAVSDIVPAAGTSEAVVGFAVPFTAQGSTRVLSGAYAVAGSPLADLLGTGDEVDGTTAVVVDQRQRIVAARDGRLRPGSSLAEADPALAAAAASTTRGGYDGPGGRWFLAAQPVSGTPWTLLWSAPQSSLHAPLAPQQRTAWLVVGCLVLVAVAAGSLYGRLVRARDRLAHAALADHLTGLPNRRRLSRALEQCLAAAGRSGEPVSVLLVDVDHFKRVNDTFGHDAGDDALRHVAAVLQDTVRSDDLVGRWGGEEFLAVLPRTSPEAAAEIGERLRVAVAERSVPLGGGGDDVRLTVSIGCATASGGQTAVVLYRADRALYRAKQGGRDRTVSV